MMEDYDLLSELPFHSVSDPILHSILCTDDWSHVIANEDFRNYLRMMNSSELLDNLNFKYVTDSQFNSYLGNLRNNIELSLFHLNVRSLNSKHRSLCQFLELLEVNFDVIVLTEIWAYNIDFYLNILEGYTFYYELPKSSKIGGVGIYVKDSLSHQQLSDYNIAASDIQVENVWLEINKNRTKYIIGGIYRHPNQRIDGFQDALEVVLHKISNQKHQCLIAGDINIDLSKSPINTETADYLGNLLLNNFLPTIVMPTRITQNTATLIDHIYYYEGLKRQDGTRIMSGNFIHDLSDHLPNYTILINDINKQTTTRPWVRIYSKTNKQTFYNKLQLANWHSVYELNDVHDAYNQFNDIITKAFNESFITKQLSRKRAKDKKWITSALKNSSKTKNSLYKKWLITRNFEDEKRYKNYRKLFRKTAAEAEKLYYKELFDLKTNSIQQLWNNLNTVCSFKGGKNKRSNISKIIVNDRCVTEKQEICDYMNYYFSTVGEKLVEELENKTHNIQSYDYAQYCNKRIKSSMFLEPVDRVELTAIIKEVCRS